jgi:hypothetical protein
VCSFQIGMDGEVRMCKRNQVDTVTHSDTLVGSAVRQSTRGKVDCRQFRRERIPDLGALAPKLGFKTVRIAERGMREKANVNKTKEIR